MSKHYPEYLKHILSEADFLLAHTKNLKQESFLEDDVLRRAFVRSIEIIGEAVKRLPKEFREKYTDVDWKAMAGARDKLIHHYFGVDYEIVWDIVTTEIPELRVHIQKILDKEGK